MAEPIRILFVEVDRGGPCAEYNVHARLADFGHRLGAESASISAPGFSTQASSVKRHEVQLRRRSGSRLQRLVGLAPEVITSLPKLHRGSRIFEPEAPDIVYSSQARIDVLVGFLLGRLHGVPHVVHLHYSFGPWLGRLSCLLIRRSALVVAVSEYVRQTALLAGIDPERVVTVANALDARAELVDSVRVRRELGIGDDDVVVIAVGRLDRSKGVDRLISAIAELAADRPQLRLLICGESMHDREHAAELRALAASCEPDVVSFLGWREDVDALLAASDVFCLPSVQEPFGLVFLEAMQAALPVIALQSGGTPEIVIDGVTGLLSYPADRNALVRNLKAVVDDPGLRRDLGRRGRERLASEFAVERWADCWMSHLRAVIASSAS